MKQICIAAVTQAVWETWAALVRFIPRIFQSRICYDVTRSNWTSRVQFDLFKSAFCKVSLTPPPPCSFSRSSSTPSQAKGNGLRLPPHFNGRNALVLDTSLSPCRLALPPCASHSLPSHSPSPRLPHPLPIPITSPSPHLLHSLSVSSLHLLHPHPSSHHPHPSPVSPLPLVVSLSPLPFSLSLSLSLSSQ